MICTLSLIGGAALSGASFVWAAGIEWGGEPLPAPVLAAASLTLARLPFLGRLRLPARLPGWQRWVFLRQGMAFRGGGDAVVAFHLIHLCHPAFGAVGGLEVLQAEVVGGRFDLHAHKCRA